MVGSPTDSERYSPPIATLSRPPDGRPKRQPESRHPDRQPDLTVTFRPLAAVAIDLSRNNYRPDTYSAAPFARSRCRKLTLTTAAAVRPSQSRSASTEVGLPVFWTTADTSGAAAKAASSP